MKMVVGFGLSCGILGLVFTRMGQSLNFMRIRPEGGITKAENHDRITFLETSGKGTVSLRLMTSIESAAKHNPNMKILVYLFSKEEVQPTEIMTAVANKYPNVQYIHTTEEEVFHGTVVYEWYVNDLPKSLYRMEQMSDVLRLIILWRMGGIYMDLDTITLKEISLPKNAVFYTSYVGLENAVLAFQKHHPFLELTLDGVKSHYTGLFYPELGPLLLTNIYWEYEKNHKDIVGFKSGSIIAKVPLYNYRCAFNPTCAQYYLDLVGNASIIHWTNKLSTYETPNNSAYMKLTSMHAPITFRAITNSTSEDIL